MTQKNRTWQEDLEQIFGGSVNQDTLEEAAVLMVSVSAIHLEYHAVCMRALEEGIRAASKGDAVVIGIVNRSGYRVGSTNEARELLEDFLRIYLGTFNRFTSSTVPRMH